MLPEFNLPEIPVEFPTYYGPLSRVRLLFGHYDLRVFLSNHAYIDIGRGSFDAATYVVHLMEDSVGCIGRVGQFCDFSPTTKLFAGGEHHNDQPVNVVWTNIPVFGEFVNKYKIADLDPVPARPFSIGNGVVVSADANILPGAQIGDGTVVAANGVVHGATERFSIVGGVPARKIKSRIDDQTMAAMDLVRWWDFDTVYLGRNLDRLQELAVDTSAKHVYRKPSPRFVMKLIKSGSTFQELQVLGFMNGEEFMKLSEAPLKVQSYVQQLQESGPYRWIANIWD